LNAAGDAYERAVSRAHRGMSWWFLILTATYLLGQVAVWSSRDFRVERTFQFFKVEGR